MMRPVEATVAFSTRRPWLVIAAAALLALLGLWVTVTRFAINTDTARLISPDVEWRRLEIASDRAFPQRTELLAVVLDAPTPETADEPAERLVAAMRGMPDAFRSVDRPGSGPFFERNGLLFLSRAELGTQLAALGEQGPLLSILAGDPSLRGVAQTIGATLLGLRSGEITLEALAPRYDAFSTVIERTLAGEPARLSWRNLTGGAASRAELRRIILARPVIDYGALQPGAAATDRLRQTATALGLTSANGITVRVTGPVALADEEFATVAENMELNIGLTLLAVVAILFAALRSPKLMAAVLLTLLAGLVLTCGLGLLMVGELNLISVAFFVLFIGLGVDFGIQVAVRYRAERHKDDDPGRALRAASRGVGFALTLAALSLVAGFLSFLPTEFRGVSELGLIAGMGMVVAYAASFTLLPALIVVMRPPPEAAPVETAALAKLDHWILRHRRAVLAGTALVVLAGTPALLALRFDSDPMNLRDARIESVATYRDLAANPDTSPNSLEVLVPDAGAAAALVPRLSALPEVSRVISLATFVPDEQDAKLTLVREAASELGAVLDPFRPPPPSGGEIEAALKTAAERLREAAGSSPSPGRPAAERLAGTLLRLAGAPAEVQERARRAVLVDFDRLRETLRAALQPEPVMAATLPPEITAAWVAVDGRARVEVFPKADLADPVAAERFVAAVRAVAPAATGAPVTILESGRTITRAFLQAGLYALAAITLLLWIAMRRLADVALALGPLVLAGIVTLQAAQLFGLPLNLANIIALPLMFGVGVAFHIYYLVAWREGAVDMLASSLTRAIFFSALTTGTAFGSLWASSHPGTSSMGELLAVSLVFTLLAAFIVVPAFLGPPPEPAAAPPSPPGR